MPELPEVETIRLQLQKFIVGHRIEDVQINYSKIFSGDKNQIIGSQISDVRRFAKVLSIDLSNGFSIVVHVKLTGQLIYRGPNLKSPPPLSKKVVGGVPGLPAEASAKAGKHTHVIFKLDKNGFLYYNDVRRFGWIKIIESSKLKVQNDFLAKLGPEPQVAQGSEGQAFLTLELFEKILSSTSRSIKVVLMDQAKIGGVGNIYANDALWLAKINPRIQANRLQSYKVTELYKAIHKVLEEGIKYGGSSELAYVTPDGHEGEYQNYTLAYGQEGKLCPRCKKSKFQKYFLSGRGTYICPTCQDNSDLGDF